MILPKLYAISMMWTLNARLDVRTAGAKYPTGQAMVSDSSNLALQVSKRNNELSSLDFLSFNSLASKCNCARYSCSNVNRNNTPDRSWRKETSFTWAIFLSLWLNPFCRYMICSTVVRQTQPSRRRPCILTRRYKHKSWVGPIKTICLILVEVVCSILLWFMSVLCSMLFL
jgi:hypothetical protein